MVINHCFDVKGVGAVVLGKVEHGKIKQYDNLKSLPAGIDVMIKSIKMHDDPAEETGSARYRIHPDISGALRHTKKTCRQKRSTRPAKNSSQIFH